MLDLHSHSYFSDGALSPEQVVRLAAAAGVEMLALTDHDTLDGVGAFLAAAAAVPDFFAVPGIELSKNDDLEILCLGLKNPRAFDGNYRDSFKDIIELAMAMDGFPVLAHPVRTKKRGRALEELVVELKGYGLAGIECFHREHSADLAAECLDLAERHELIVTCGSDFHGHPGDRTKFGYMGEGDWQNCPALSQTARLIRQHLE